jgi:phage shock protein PspC (stress-responsive transcriptional regulator)
MKKTLTVNISGSVFHIDEDAYNVLNDYLQSIKKHFSRTEGREEIISDFEARIAEMLHEQVSNGKQVITIEDIGKVMDVIGQPSEFDGDQPDEDGNKSEKNGKANKRLYRDPDNTIIAGVCSGLGSYFHSDPVWFRLAFVLAIIFGFGTGFIVYIILWIVLPEAVTTAEKLEMKGEKVNISNIEKSIREEIDNLKDKFKDFTHDAKQTYKKKSGVGRSGVDNAANIASRMIEIFVKLILIFVGIILLTIGLSLIVAFLVALFGFGDHLYFFDSELVYVSFQTFTSFILGGGGSNAIFTLALLMLIGIPIFLVIYGGIKLIFGLNNTKYVGITAINLWVIGLIVTSVYAFIIFKSFSHQGVVDQHISMNSTEGKPLLIDLKNDKNLDRIMRYEDYVEIDEFNMVITSNERDMFYGVPELKIEMSKNDFFELEVFYRSKGKNNSEATKRAQNIVYHYSKSDSSIVLDPYFKLTEDEIWREQKVEMVLKVPEGKYVEFSDDMYKILNDRNHSGYKLSGDIWLMTNTGLEKAEMDLRMQSEEDDPDEILEQIEKEEDDNGSKPVSAIAFFYFRLNNLFQALI